MNDTDTDTGKILAELGKLDRRCGHIHREVGELKTKVDAVSAKVHAEMVDRRDDDLEQTRQLNKLQSKVLAKNAGAGAGGGAMAVGVAEVLRWVVAALGVMTLLSCSSSLAQRAVEVGETECLARAETEVQREACHVAACGALRTVDRRSEDGREEKSQEEKSDTEESDEESDEEKAGQE